MGSSTLSRDGIVEKKPVVKPDGVYVELYIFTNEFSFALLFFSSFMIKKKYKSIAV